MAAEIITTEDLYLFKAELFELIHKLCQQSPTPQKRWLRTSEVRKLIAISPNTLQNLRIEGKLPYSRINNVIYYPYEGLMQMMENHLHPARPDKATAAQATLANPSVTTR